MSIQNAMLRYPTSLGVLLAILVTGTIQAQDRPAPLSLTQALESAVRQSPDVRAAREAVTAAEGRERQAGAWPNPTFSYGREQTSAGGQKNSQDVAALEQRVEFGGIRAARVDAARLRRDAAVQRLSSIETQVIFETSRAYALAVSADRRAELAMQAADAFSSALAVSERRLAAGDVSGYAHRRIRLEAARYAAARAEALLARRTARLMLASLVSQAVEGLGTLEFALVDSLPSSAVIPSVAISSTSTVPDSLIRLALVSRADLRGLELEAAAGAADARLAATERTPIPALSLGFKREQLAGVEGQATGFVAGFSLPLPIWDRRAGLVAAANAEVRRRTAEVDAFRRRVVREVSEAYESYVTLRSQLDALEPQLGRETTTAMRAVQVAYSEGEVSVLEWLDAVRAFQEAETSYANLRAEALIRRAALERAIGANVPPRAGRSGTATPDKDQS
jgi:cobalt-zinc-cadmium efflux system outer membrane protein